MGCTKHINNDPKQKNQAFMEHIKLENTEIRFCKKFYRIDCLISKICMNYVKVIKQIRNSERWSLIIQNWL